MVAAEAIETEAVQLPSEEPELDAEQRRIEREKALARIPADAYDIPLPVLALSGPVLGHLRSARIENLGEIMERLADGDQGLLSLEGIDRKALDEIKMQVEIMVSIPGKEPETDGSEEEATATELAPVQRPRFVYVADDEMEEKTKSRPRRRVKQRRPVLDDDLENVATPQPGDATYLDWDEFDE